MVWHDDVLRFDPPPPPLWTRRDGSGFVTGSTLARRRLNFIDGDHCGSGRRIRTEEAADLRAGEGTVAYWLNDPMDDERAQETLFIRVSSPEVTCTGSKDDPHEPVLVAVPAMSTARCPICGRQYVRAPAWLLRARAVWPKPF